MKHGRQRLLALPFGALVLESLDRCRRDNGVRIQFAGRRGDSSTLGNHVVDIVLMCSQKKVRWIHACAIVASVKYAKPFRDRTNQKFPRDPVRFLCCFVLAESGLKSTVAVLWAWIYVPGPPPTSVDRVWPDEGFESLSPIHLGQPRAQTPSPSLPCAARGTSPAPSVPSPVSSGLRGRA